jgi:precorrin-6B methylase 2
MCQSIYGIILGLIIIYIFININSKKFKGGNNLISYISKLYINTPNIYGIPHNKYNTVYGELNLEELTKVFHNINIKKNDIFYDLGCGSGKINLYMALKYNIKSIGIEIIEERINVAKTIEKKVKNKNIIFKNNDMFKENFSNGTIFYAYNLTWPEKIDIKIIKKIKKEAKKCKYIILTKLLEHPHIKLYKTLDNINFSSHVGSIYIYKLV